MNLIRKIMGFFDARAKKQLVMLFFFMVVGSLFEALGVGLILPFISIINNPKEIESFGVIRNVYNSLNPSSYREFLIWFGLGLIAVYVIKNLFLLVLAYFQNRFIYHQQAVISRNLLSSYLYSPYTFHLQRNTAELIRNITMSLGAVFGGAIIPFMTILAEIPVIISISILLFVVEPWITIAACAIIGILSALFYRYVRGRIGHYGALVQETGTNMIMWANQSVGGIKEIKIGGTESYFLDAFSRHRFENARVNVFFSVVQKIPRLYLELVLMGGMLLVLLAIIVNGGEFRDFLPVISLFAFAALRIMPSVGQIVTSLNAMKFAHAAVDDVYDDVRHFRENTVKPDKAAGREHRELAQGIEIKDISYSYPGSESLVFRNISLTIKKGESVAFVGPSGSGKTTLANIILGLLPPVSGLLLVDGRNIYESHAAMRTWQDKIGFVPQDTYLIDDSLKRNIAFGVPDDQIDVEKVWDVLRQAHLEKTVKDWPGTIETNLGENGVRLSGGQKQRVSIARALYHNPSVLVMDEATSSLDTETESEISKAIDEMSRRKTIIIIAHRLSTVKNCDRLIFLKNGRIAGIGKFDELIAGNADFKTMTQYTDIEAAAG